MQIDDPDVYLDPTCVDPGLTLGELRALCLILALNRTCGGRCGQENCEVFSFVFDCGLAKLARELMRTTEEEVPGFALDHLAQGRAKLDQWQADLAARGLLS